MPTLIETLCITLIAFFGYSNAMMGSSMLDRPLIISPLIGLVLGDLHTGIIVGATLELVWLGAFPVGASNPPDMVSGTVIGASFVISSGSDPSTAVALAVPVATLVMMFSNLMMMIVIPKFFVTKADHSAQIGDVAGVEKSHFGAWIVYVGILSILVGVSYYVGSPAIESVLNAIPEFILHGLAVATGIIPAIGFAMLVRMIATKDVAAFFFGGFLLNAYLGVPVLGVALMAGVIVAVLLSLQKNQAKGEMVIDYDDNEF